MPEHTIAENLQRLQTAKTAIGNAITAKGGTVSQGDGLEEFASDIATIPSGGGTSQPRKDVNFFDYDGTIVNSYTAAEFANLSAMPDNPSHEGLTAQGWNWSFANAEDYVSKYGVLDVGQTYIPTDGKTKICIVLNEIRTIQLGLGVNGTVTIDWGDNSNPDTLSGNSVSTYISTTHTYDNSGEYIISLTVSGDAKILRTYDNLICGLIVKPNSNANESYVYANVITKIFFGNNITVENSSLRNLSNLQSITFPKDYNTSFSSYFIGCISLKHITYPLGCTYFGGCNGTTALESVSISQEGANYDANAFINCNTLNRLIIPEGHFSSTTSLGGSTSMKLFVMPKREATISTTLTMPFTNCKKIIIGDWISINIPQGTLREILFPQSVRYIGGIICNGVESIEIPSLVTSINQVSCYGLKVLKFNGTTPPTVSQSITIPTDCKIYVPTGSLSAYTSAAKYPDSNTYTYVEY